MERLALPLVGDRAGDHRRGQAEDGADLGREERREDLRRHARQEGEARRGRRAGLLEVSAHPLVGPADEGQERQPVGEPREVIPPPPRGRHQLGLEDRTEDHRLTRRGLGQTSEFSVADDGLDCKGGASRVSAPHAPNEPGAHLPSLRCGNVRPAGARSAWACTLASASARWLWVSMRGDRRPPAPNEPGAPAPNEPGRPLLYVVAPLRIRAAHSEGARPGEVARPGPGDRTSGRVMTGLSKNRP